MSTSLCFTRKKLWIIIPLTLAIIAGIFGGAPITSQAAGLVVNSADDDEWAHDSLAGDGVCMDLSMRCTLRAALEEANALPGADSITFSGPMQINIDLNEGGLPSLDETIIIDASSVWDTTNDQPGVILNGNGGSFGGFYLGAGSSAIRGLYITGFNGSGLYMPSASNTIGGNGAGQRNVISGNTIGITLAGGAAQSNMIHNNYLGLSLDGLGGNPNGTGIIISGGANNNSIGGSANTLGNFISGNTHDGVLIEQTGSDDNWLANNVFGLTGDMTTAAGNGNYGIRIFNGPANTLIGGSLDTGNYIGFNTYSGIYIDQAGNNSQIMGNIIGGNLEDGINITHSAGSVVTDNLIANNQQNGVRVVGATAVGNLILENSITDNAFEGIYLQVGGNLNIATPTIQTGSSSSASGTACAGCTVALYSDAADEGQIYSGVTTADGAGNWRLDSTFTGPNITATAIDGSSNTSEFSQPFAIPHQIFLPLIIKP